MILFATGWRVCNDSFDTGAVCEWSGRPVPAYLETARMPTAVAHASLSDPELQWPKPEAAQAGAQDADRKMMDRRIKGRERSQSKELNTRPDSLPSSFCQPLPPPSFFEALPRPLVVAPKECKEKTLGGW